MSNAQKNIVIVGGSYGGNTVATLLMKMCAANGISITLIDKYEKRFNIVGTPRGLVDASFGPKQFFGWEGFFSKPEMGRFVHGLVVSVLPTEVILESGEHISYDYLVYAAGSSYGSVGTALSLSIAEHQSYLKQVSDQVSKANQIHIIGGGAYGVELAAEIRYMYKTKKVVLIHSQSQLAFGDTSANLHVRALKKLTDLGVNVVLEEKVTSESAETMQAGIKTGTHTLTTQNNKTFESDLTIFTIGFGTPNSGAMSTLPATSVDKPHLNSRGLVLVKKTLQLMDDQYPCIFALGNVAATGAPLTAISVKQQASVVADNISLLIASKPLKEFNPAKQNMIVVTIGPKDAVAEIPYMFNFLADIAGTKMKSSYMFNDMVAKENRAPFVA